MARDYYEVLGVGRDADPDELQQAYRGLARALHPDVNTDPAAEERFKEVNEAYHVLADPQTRRRYDRFGPDFRQVADGVGHPAGADPGRNGGTGGFRGGGFGGAAGGAGPDPGGVDPGGVDLGGIDLDDLFGGIFGSRGRVRPSAGADREATIELSVEDAYRGGRRQITLAGVSGPVGYDVTIPAGVVTGRRIRLAGQGGPSPGGGPAGDLLLTIRLAPHPRYRLDGRDISVDLPVSPWEAALGATVPLPTPGGELTVRVPPGSSTGRRLRLRGQGMPDHRGTPGDLYAEVRIMVPTRPDDRERELYEQLAGGSNFDPRSGS